MKHIFVIKVNWILDDFGASLNYDVYKWTTVLSYKKKRFDKMATRTALVSEKKNDQQPRTNQNKYNTVFP